MVAIALTLLVLQLPVPGVGELRAAPDSARSLADYLGGSAFTSLFTSYVVSFYVIATFWLAHHRVFRLVRGHHEGLAWWNFAFLFTITIMPFTSELLGKYPSNPLAVDIFAVNLLLASLATQVVVVFGRRRGLLIPGASADELRAGRARAVAVGLILVTSATVAWESTSAARYLWILLLFVPRFARWWGDRRAGSSGMASATAGG